MKTKSKIVLEDQTDNQLLEWAASAHKNSELLRIAIGEDKHLLIHLLELNTAIIEVLADRLRGCSPHIEKT